MTTDLSALTRTGGARSPQVPVSRPPRRLVTRVALPAAIALAALALVAYAARESLRPAVPVTVMPVVPRAGGGGTSTGTPQAPGEIVQAPGWIEADPNAISVPALEPGVVKELLVLDGQRVEPGQTVALLIDDDARLIKRQAEAELARSTSAVAESKAALAAEEARAEEARDALRRIEPLAGTGAFPENEIIAMRLRAATANAAVAIARAAVSKAESELPLARVALDKAELALSRLKVVAPIGGVVLQRMVEPGQRLMPDANNPFAGVVVRLYDPAHLQVRVDIPLSDAAKVREGDKVEVTTETLPGRAFKATLTRFVHEANIQKNTVQVKASIADPVPELKPDMLAKARITTRPAQSTPREHGAMNHDATPGETVLIAPRAALLEHHGEHGTLWVVDRATSTADKRTLRLGLVTGETVEVLQGLRPGDRVIINPPATLQQGTKVQTDDHGDAK